PNRKLVMGRGGSQLVLDLSNPKVQDYVFGIVDNLLTRYPEIAYIKWDANMSIQSHGSRYLPADEQSHLYIAYEQGLRKVCERIRAKFPDVVMQDCASGGARVNWGMLPYFDEFWTSDNTDALQRVYMQWGVSHFFPAIAMASHISASPNHQTQRSIPLKYRIDVAMSGRLGMELQPSQMTVAERAQCRKAIAEYKEVRPVVQMGDVYRLISPYDGLNVASLMYVSEAKDKAVFYWWKLETYVDERLPRVRMAGLDPHRMYKIRELNRADVGALPMEGKVFSGAYLMERGIDVPGSHKFKDFPNTDWASRVLYLEAQ
ncbi:MAG: alpha-galactosidase, partial [Bacteroidales bacterium]|nr:alpha-galactosidase [Bacteroidales bacterium]